MVNTQYGSGNALVVLSLICPFVDLKNRFHIDHIHPRNGFNEEKFDTLQLTGEQRKFYYDHMNALPNLQLLEATPNDEKNDMPFSEWMEKRHPDPEEKQSYMKLHYIPDTDLRFSNFESFFKQREQLILKKLKEELLPSKSITE